MLSLSSRQLCDYYLDGNIEAAFEVFEHAGPEGLRQFLGIREEVTWRRVYKVLLRDYAFLEQLWEKYRVYLVQLIEEQGVHTLREILHIDGFQYDVLVNRLFSLSSASEALDDQFSNYMRVVFHRRQRSQVGDFFISLRNILRRDLGF